jgi:hypothetical protein
MAEEHKTLKQRAYHEFKEFLLLSLYLWIFLGMFIVFKSMVLAEEHIDFVAHGVAIINAMLLAKFLLIVRALHLGRRADDDPLIYPTLIKSAISALALMALKILEDAAVGYFHGKSFADSIADLGGGNWQAVLIFTGMLFVVLIPLNAFGEVQRILGEGKLYDLFFRPRDLSKPFGQRAV